MFKFRFEVLRKVKRIRNDMAQQALASAQRRLNDLMTRRYDCLSKIAHSGDDMLGMFSHEVTPTELSLFYNQQRALMENVEEFTGSIIEAEAEVEQKRAELLTAMKEFKAMERLKEIKRQEYETSQVRLENKAIDEMAITRHKARV